MTQQDTDKAMDVIARHNYAYFLYPERKKTEAEKAELKDALEVLRPNNVPYTKGILPIEELMEMEGEPVWLEYSTGSGEAMGRHWDICQGHEWRDGAVEDWIAFAISDSMPVDDYGASWWAFRTKQEEWADLLAKHIKDIRTSLRE